MAEENLGKLVERDHPVTPSPRRPVILLRLTAVPGPMVGLLGMLTLFILLLAWRGELGTFLSYRNVQVLVHASTTRAVVALGMLLIIISGGIDLSVGSVVALITVVSMQTYRWVEQETGSMLLSSIAGVLAGLGVGAMSGLANGLAITRLKVSPFVATLGMFSMARGLAYWVSGGATISFPGARPGWVDALARFNWEMSLFGQTVNAFALGSWSLLLLAGSTALLLRYTVFGRYCYAIGSNEATARLCGVPVELYKVFIYTLAGLLTGWAGVLAFAQGTGGNPHGMVGLELDVIAAVVIGGASLSGGQGTVLGTLLGVLMLGILDNGVSMFNVPVQLRLILIGGIIVLNTALSQWQRRRAE